MQSQSRILIARPLAGFARKFAFGPLLIAAGLATAIPPNAPGAPCGYKFDLIRTLGDPIPPASGSGSFVNDFEPGGLNNHGDIAFGADVSTGGEGIFLRHNARITELGRTGTAAPGGGLFASGFLGPVGLNDQGDIVFDFLLEESTLPFGVNAGAYRYSHTTKKVTAVVVPYVTPAPGGGAFQGVFFQPTIDNRGNVVFGGIVQTSLGVHNVPDNGEAYIGLGVGVFRSDAVGRLSSLVSPGAAVPGGGRFDYAAEPWVNDGGDVSFIGHIAGQESVIAGFPPQATLISALGGLYVKKSGTGKIFTTVPAGASAPGGGKFRQVYHDVMNNCGEIAFDGDLTPAPGANQNIGVFLFSGSKIMAIARPGNSMPGGGRLVNASLVDGNVHINNRGDVVFSGIVDTDVDGDQNNDTGLFLWSHGKLSVIVRTGTVIPGVGIIDELASPQLVIPPPPIDATTSGAINNDAGQVVFQASLTDGRGVLLLASPTK